MSRAPRSRRNRDFRPTGSERRVEIYKTGERHTRRGKSRQLRSESAQRAQGWPLFAFKGIYIICKHTGRWAWFGFKGIYVICKHAEERTGTK